MQTVAQALSLLDYFSENQPELGLSELANVAGFDKAKTRRYLLALIKQGFVEQNSESKRYRLGTALLRLSRVREACFPIETIVKPMLEELVAQCGETAHFSLLSGTTLGNICVVESPRAHRITMDEGGILPLHATASGLAYLSHSPNEFINRYLKQELKSFTKSTETNANNLKDNLTEIKKSGLAKSIGGYDEGVISFAIPILGGNNYAIGAIAVAAPSSRTDNRAESIIKNQLKTIANKIEVAISGDNASRIPNQTLRA